VRPSRAAGRVPLKGMHFASSAARTRGENSTGMGGGPAFDFQPYEGVECGVAALAGDEL
jgi:hypothetical protein